MAYKTFICFLSIKTFLNSEGIVTQVLEKQNNCLLVAIVYFYRIQAKERAHVHLRAPRNPQARENTRRHVVRYSDVAILGSLKYNYLLLICLYALAFQMNST